MSLDAGRKVANARDANPMLEMTPEQTLACQNLERLDAVSRKMEGKWGVNKLPQCVDPELAAKWERQWTKLGQAVEEFKYLEQVELCQGCIRGWEALERAAVANGYKPDDGQVMECRLPSGGVLRVCSNRLDAEKPVPAGYEVWTLDQVANVIESQRLVSTLAERVRRQENPHEIKKLENDFWVGGGDTIPF